MSEKPVSSELLKTRLLYHMTSLEKLERILNGGLLAGKSRRAPSVYLQERVFHPYDPALGGYGVSIGVDVGSLQVSELADGSFRIREDIRPERIREVNIFFSNRGGAFEMPPKSFNEDYPGRPSEKIYLPSKSKASKIRDRLKKKFGDIEVYLLDYERFKELYKEPKESYRW